MRGGASIELTNQSKRNLDLQLKKLNKLSSKSAYDGLIKILFDIKALSQNKLKYDKHIVTSRLRNSMYVQTPKPIHTADNSENYKDNNGKSYSSVLDTELSETEGAVGTNVGYGSKIEYLYDSFLYWALKNVDLNKRWREVSAELLNGLK